jgi:hypothetical protein
VAPLALVREQLRTAAAAALERPDDVGDLRVPDRHDAALASFARVVEPQLVADRSHVSLAQGGQPVAAVLVDIRLAADPEQPQLEQAHGAGQHAVAAHAVAREVTPYPAPQPGESAGQIEHPVVLVPITLGPPLLVVAVLALAPGIEPAGLDVAAGFRAYPNVGPRGRDGERLDAVDDRGVGDAPALLVVVAEAPAGPAPAESGPRRVDLTDGHASLLGFACCGAPLDFPGTPRDETAWARRAPVPPAPRDETAWARRAPAWWS